MDKKSKILLWVLLFLIIGSVAVTYWRIMIKKDYMIEAQADCDPTIDKCFIWQCDPASTVEGEKCTGDPDKDTWYYQIIKRKAANIPLCDPADENCRALVCEDGEKDCSATFCDDTNKEEQGAECNDPEQYNIDNPAEEDGEAAECDPESEDCPTDESADATDENATTCDPASEDCAANDASADPNADTQSAQ
jgi:hypothetical protein